MKGRGIKRVFVLVQVVVFSLIFAISAEAHSGKVDKNGGHKSKKSGTYHYHAGKDRKVEYKTKQESEQASKQSSKQAIKPTTQPTPQSNTQKSK